MSHQENLCVAPRSKPASSRKAHRALLLVPIVCEAAATDENEWEKRAAMEWSGILLGGRHAFEAGVHPTAGFHSTTTLYCV